MCDKSSISEEEDMTLLTKRAITTFLVLLSIGSGSSLLWAQDDPGHGSNGEESIHVKHLIESLEIGPLQTHENLFIAPIYTGAAGPGVAGPRYDHLVTLEEALHEKWLSIQEKEGGTVPSLTITNLSNRYVYIMGGEILSGGKQDRIVARDVIVGPRKRNLSIPVFCVEHGRWHVKSDKFYSKKNLGTHKLRSQAQAGKSVSQSNIWKEIDESNRKLGVRSDTEAYQDAYANSELQDQLEKAEKEMMANLELHDDAIGVVVAVGNEIVSVDLFAAPSLFKKLWPKILRSSVLTAATAEMKGSLTRKEAIDYLRSLSRRTYITRSAIDQGTELYSEDGRLSINALVYEGGIVHLAAFPVDPTVSGSGDNSEQIRGSSQLESLSQLQLEQPHLQRVLHSTRSQNGHPRRPRKVVVSHNKL
jgi:hypothetical protein